MPAVRDINAQNGKTQKITLSQCWLLACLLARLLGGLVVLVIGAIRFGSVRFELVLVAIYFILLEHNIDIIHDDCLYGGTFHNHAPI